MKRSKAYRKAPALLEEGRIYSPLEAANLPTALRSTTTAGTWGELQLRRVVELSGMSNYCDFAEQQSAGGFRPDLIVRLPGGQQIIIDAKAPNDAYREAANTADEVVRAAKLAEHATKVRNHIDALGALRSWRVRVAVFLVIVVLGTARILEAAAK